MIGRALKGLMVAAVAAPLLAACVVYDSTGGENVTVQVNDRDAAPAEAAAAGAWLHGHAARIAAGVLDGSPGQPIVALDVAHALPPAIADLLA